MKRYITAENSRWIQLAGLLIAIAGLTGFWLSRDVGKSSLTPEQLALVNPDGEEFHASFVVAGRDYDISRYASPCEWVDDVCFREEAGDFRLGNRTDTILYVNLAGNDITIVAIPRDIWLPQWQTRINAMYLYQKAAGLKRSVEEIIGVPIDYYAVVNIDIFEELVDAVGGVDVNIPYDMYYRDSAAGLVIDFDEGPAHLDGADAAKFVRYRNTRRSDYDRMDNVKRLAYALLARVKELNVRAVGAVPALVETLLRDVETNVSPALVRKLLPRLGDLRIVRTATLPTEEILLESGIHVLRYQPERVERFLASTMGGTARTFSEPPAATLLITNRSGQQGLETWYRQRLVTLGIPAERVLTRTASFDPAPSRILTTADNWREADYYAALLRTGKQQIDSLPVVDRLRADMEFVLGHDATIQQGRGVAAALAGAPKE
jgi:LCP family protein required for cell wall assembly